MREFQFFFFFFSVQCHFKFNSKFKFNYNFNFFVICILNSTYAYAIVILKHLPHDQSSRLADLTRDLSGIDELLAEHETLENAASAADLIAKAAGLEERTRAFLAGRDAPPRHIPSATPEFLSEVTPRYTCGIFRLRPFTKLRGRTGNDVVYSEPLEAHGVSFRLKVYPNGNGAAMGTFLSVFLEMTAVRITTTSIEISN